MTQAAGNATFLGQSQGTTTFQETIAIGLSGAPLQFVYFQIQPMSGSLTRPIGGSFGAAYLQSQGLLSGNRLYLQVFGLYNLAAGISYTNTVELAFHYTDGSVSYMNVPVTTPGYTSYCPSLNNITLHQFRHSTSDLGFDYIFLKEYCRSSITAPADGPAIIDTDGRIRWVGAANGIATSAATLTNGNKTVYASDGTTGLRRIDVNTGLVTTTADFRGQYYTAYLGDHNIDPGRNGTMLIGANRQISSSATMLEDFIVETDSIRITNTWDFRQIIFSAMQAGGDDPSQFIPPPGPPCSSIDPACVLDWFHENSVYNPADNTLIVSSRENFVMAVDYDFPSDGSAKKIHWIFGDTTKQWYTFPSLRRFALAYSSPAYPPVGQHSISLDPYGNLMMMNDGGNSAHHTPPGVAFNSFAAKYQINLSKMLATYVFGYGSFGSGTYFSSPFCGSAYDFNAGAGDSYLVDFTLQKAAGAAGAFSETPNSVFAEIQGLRSDETLVFDLQIPQAMSPDGCGHGWNAIPVDLSGLAYY